MRKRDLPEVEKEIREFVRELTAQDKGLFKDGTERLDPIPVAPPLGYTREPSMFDHMRSLIRSEMLKNALNADVETFEEADDFDVGDDYDPRSPYEVEFDDIGVPYAAPSYPPNPPAAEGGGGRGGGLTKKPLPRRPPRSPRKNACITSAA